MRLRFALHFVSCAAITAMLMASGVGRAYADSFSLGAGTGTLTVYAHSTVCSSFGYCSPGFDITGGIIGTTSNGLAYSLGGLGPAWFASNPMGDPNPPANQWQWTLVGAFQNGYFLDLDFSGTSQGSGLNANEYNSGLTLTQASDGTGTITLFYSDVNTIAGTLNYVLTLNVDPVMLSSLQDGQSVNLTMTGGCSTTGSSCNPPAVPEPTSLALLISGLPVAAFGKRRRRKSA